VWSGKGLVEVEVHYIETHIARPNNTHDCIEICTVIVEKSSSIVDEVCNTFDVVLEEAKGIRVGEHDTSNRLIEMGLQVVERKVSVAV
jgi:hypothetical protein